MKATRESVVAEAQTWVGTPYHHCADIKGVGVDCAMLLVRVFCDLGLCPPFDPRPYAPQWYLHKDEPKFLNWLKQQSKEVAYAQPGDVALFNFGRHAAHGAIIVDEHTLIHAYLPQGRVERDDRRNENLKARLHSYWSVF